MSSDYFDIRAYLEAETARRQRELTDGIPTEYAGTRFRSRLEAGWATTLDGYGIRWEYEPEMVTLDSGARYLPDFRLPELATVIEAKGPHMQRLDKTREYATAHRDVITIIGYSPQRRSLSPYLWESYMQWADALGGNALFTQCPQCRAFQWCRPRYYMSCRKCGERLDGHFATCGEMRFTDWTDQPLDLPGMNGSAA